MLDKKLEWAKLTMSADQALRAVRTIQVVDILIGDQHKQSTTPGSKRAQQVLSALKIKDINPEPAATRGKNPA